MNKTYNINPKILNKQFKLIIIDPKRIKQKSLTSFIEKITSKEEKEYYNL